MKLDNYKLLLEFLYIHRTWSDSEDRGFLSCVSGLMVKSSFFGIVTPRSITHYVGQYMQELLRRPDQLAFKLS